jgi:hypothetical protein
MTVAEAITNALGNTEIESVAQMTAESGLQLLRCLNKSVQLWYKTAPRIFREKRYSHTITAPRTIASLAVTNGATSVAASTFATSEFCQALVIAGEPDFANRVAGTASLRHKIRQATGTTSATLYHDVIALADWSIERIVGEPKLLDYDCRIPRAPRNFSTLAYQNTGDQHLAASSMGDSTRTGRYPTSYDIEALGHSRVESSDAHMAIRFWPLPTDASTIELTLSLMPRRYTLLDLQDDTVELPIPDELFDLTLMPLIEWELSLTKLYSGNPKAANDLRNAALLALDVIKRQDSTWGMRHIRIDTKPGF